MSFLSHVYLFTNNYAYSGEVEHHLCKECLQLKCFDCESETMTLPGSHQHRDAPWEYVKFKSGKKEPGLSPKAAQLYSKYINGDTAKLQHNAKSFAKTRK